jgi:hypothetical protein
MCVAVLEDISRQKISVFICDRFHFLLAYINAGLSHLKQYEGSNFW